MIDAKAFMRELTACVAGDLPTRRLVETSYRHLEDSSFFDNDRLVRYVVVRIGMIETSRTDLDYDAHYKDRLVSLSRLLHNYLEKGIDPYNDPNPAKRATHLRSLLRAELSALLFMVDPMGLDFETNRSEYDSEAEQIEARLGEVGSVADLERVAGEVFTYMFDAEMAGQPAVRRGLKKFARQAFKLYDTGYPELSHPASESPEYEMTEEELSAFQKAVLETLRRVHAGVSDRAHLDTAINLLGNVELGKKLEGALLVTLKPHNSRAATLELYAPGDDTISFSTDNTSEEIWWEDQAEMVRDLTHMLEAVIGGRFEEWIREPLGSETLQQYGERDGKPFVTGTNVWVAPLWKRHRRTRHYTYEPY